MEERRKADPSEIFLYWFFGLGFLVPLLSHFGSGVSAMQVLVGPFLETINTRF